MSEAVNASVVALTARSLARCKPSPSDSKASGHGQVVPREHGGVVGQKERHGSNKVRRPDHLPHWSLLVEVLAHVIRRLGEDAGS